MAFIDDYYFINNFCFYCVFLTNSDGRLNPLLERVEANLTTGAYSSTDLSIDFGFTGILTIGDRIFFDLNEYVERRKKKTFVCLL